MPLAFAQNAALIASATTPAKPLAFDVVSIRPSKPGTNTMTDTSITPDGYRVIGQSLWTTLMMAYFPQGWYYWSPNRLSGAPSWLYDQYDIDAEADLAGWQKQSMVPGPPIPGFWLGLGKHGPHLAESKPDEVLPDGVRWPDGGIQVLYSAGHKPQLSMYGATMADFARVLSGKARRPVQDHTGLTGHYDIVVNWLDNADSKLPEGTVSPNDPDPLSHWDIEGLGFHLTPTKVPADTLVIDHIERPSEN